MIHNILNGAWSLGSSSNMEITQAALSISIVILSSLCCMLIFKKPRKETASLPPGPRGLPIVGYLPFLGTNLHYQFGELARHYGPIFKVQLGNRLCVVMSSPSVVKEVTRDQDVIFANHDRTVVLDVLSRGGLDIAFSPYGSYWRNMRKVFVREMLSKSNLDATYDLRKDEVREAIKFLSSKVGTTVDIGEFVFLTEAKVITSMLWGSTIEADELSKVGAEFRAVVQKAMGLLSKPNVSDFFPVIARFDIQGVAKEGEAVLQLIDEILDTIINKSMKKVSAKQGDEIKEGTTKRDFIQILLELREQEATGTPISMTEIKAILMDIVTAGTDTTATTAEWAMTEIVHNGEVMRKVQKELEDVVGVNNIVEEFHLPKLLYLDAVLKEAFRLHPALPLLVPRLPSQSCSVAGYTIPKDTKVFVNVWAIQRDPQLWEDPLDFKPERFLNEPGKWDFSGNNFHYLPFGSGRRICAGTPVAEKMLMYILASLLHLFDWQATETKEVDLSEKFGLVMTKAKPLLAIPTKRLPNSDLYTK